MRIICEHVCFCVHIISTKTYLYRVIFLTNLLRDFLWLISKIQSTTNKMQRFLDLFIFINCSTCFRRFLRPSSGAQNCTYSVRYSFHPRQQQAAALVWQYLTLYVQFCAPDDGRRKRLKNVEQFIEINSLRKVASCWLCFRYWPPSSIEINHLKTKRRLL
jgi:hypothetical protein